MRNICIILIIMIYIYIYIYNIIILYIYIYKHMFPRVQTYMFITCSLTHPTLN